MVVSNRERGRGWGSIRSPRLKDASCPAKASSGLDRLYFYLQCTLC